MEFPDLLINPGTVFANFHGLVEVPLIGRHKIDSAEAMPVVVPIHKI